MINVSFLKTFYKKKETIKSKIKLIYCTKIIIKGRKKWKKMIV